MGSGVHWALRLDLLGALLLAAACGPAPVLRIATGADAGSAATAPDAGEAGLPMDAGTSDAGASRADGGWLPRDGGSADSGPVDAGADPIDAGQCGLPVAAPDVDPWMMRLPSAGFGGTVTQTTGLHHDVFLESPAPLDYTRIGARLDWGGTIVFWGLSANPASNTIDANDTGREVQIALYDPKRSRQACAFDASCATSTASCGNSITYLGWDPVQGGDECNRGAQASWSVVGDALRLVVTPVQWNPDWNATDCRTTACSGTALPAQVQFAMDLRFLDPHVVELSLEVQSLETIDHGVAGQEFPTLYVSHGAGGPDLPLLLDSAGQTVTVDVPANDGFTMKNFVSPGPWVTFQNSARDYGVGLAMDQGLAAFQGWSGNGTTAPYFHNVRAQISFGLSHGSTVRGRAYLALGSFATIQATMSSLLSRRGPFGALDLPAATGVAHGTIPVAGWALDADRVNSVRVEIDGVVSAVLPVTTARPDVCALYPGYGGCPTVGFSGSVSAAGLGPCVHLMKVFATDADGNLALLGERLVQR